MVMRRNTITKSPHTEEEEEEAVHPATSPVAAAEEAITNTTSTMRKSIMRRSTTNPNTITMKSRNTTIPNTLPFRRLSLMNGRMRRSKPNTIRARRSLSPSRRKMMTVSLSSSISTSSIPVQVAAIDPTGLAEPDAEVVGIVAAVAQAMMKVVPLMRKETRNPAAVPIDPAAAEVVAEEAILTMRKVVNNTNLALKAMRTRRPMIPEIGQGCSEEAEDQEEDTVVHPESRERDRKKEGRKREKERTMIDRGALEEEEEEGDIMEKGSKAERRERISEASGEAEEGVEEVEAAEADGKTEGIEAAEVADGKTEGREEVEEADGKIEGREEAEEADGKIEGREEAEEAEEDGKIEEEEEEEEEDGEEHGKIGEREEEVAEEEEEDMEGIERRRERNHRLRLITEGFRVER